MGLFEPIINFDLSLFFKKKLKKNKIKQENASNSKKIFIIFILFLSKSILRKYPKKNNVNIAKEVVNMLALNKLKIIHLEILSLIFFL